MPKWGLSEAQRASRPWGLDPELLKPAKIVTDPVHGDVYLTALEQILVDSPPMQRLRRVRQLGTTHLVYPAATHSRFSHALGTLRATQDLLDAVVDGFTGPRHHVGLLDEWASATEPETRDLGDGPVEAMVFDLRIAEATVLARLGGLMHDFCHVPYGHTVEDDLDVLDAHDGNDARFSALWKTLDRRARRAIESAEGDLAGELKMLIISKKGRNPAEVSRYPFVSDIVGNTICADLMDYLRRDHLMTGLPMGLGHRFMNNFYVMRSDHPHYASRMVVRIARDGIPRADVVTELEKYLRYRYELTERVLTHRAKGAADAMMGKLLEMWHDQLWVVAADKRYPGAVTPETHRDVDAVQAAVAAADPTLVARKRWEAAPPDDAPLSKTNKAVAALDNEVRQRLDDEFVRRSDDGLLEYLQDVGDISADDRMVAVAALARAVQERRLYKMIGRTPIATVSVADLKHKKFGSATKRRQLERDAARYAGLDDGWKVVLWLPAPSMKLKVAGVLADDGSQVAELAKLSEQGGEIVKQHQNLWAISVYIDPEVAPGAGAPDGDRIAEVLLAFMGAALDVPFTRWDGRPARSPGQLAADRVSDRGGLSRQQATRLQRDFLAAAKTDAGTTFQHLLRSTWRQARLLKPSMDAKPPRDL